MRTALGRLRRSRDVVAEGGAATAQLRRAQALRDAGDGEAARRAYAEVARGQHAPAAVALAAVGLARLGGHEQARGALRRVIDSRPRPALATARAGEAAAALGELLLARALAEEALEGDEVPAAAQRVALRVLEQAGEPSAALELARRCGDGQSVARIEGTLAAYDASWRPAPAARSGERTAAPRRVVTLLESSLPHVRSGYAYRSRTLLAAQRDAGLDPVALTRLGFPANRGLTAPERETVDGIEHRRAVLPGVRSYTAVPMPEQLDAYVRWAAAAAAEVGAEATIATTPHLNGLVGLALKEGLDIPLVYDVRGFPELTWAVRPGGADSESFRLRREAETRCMREADLVTTLSETMRGQIAARGIPEERIHVLPHAVDVDAFAATERDDALAAQLGLAGRTVVGYISSLVPYEGVETLIDAIALARREDPAVAGLIVGDGALLPSLRARAERLGLGGDVVFTGRVGADEVHRYYGLTDVFVCPRHDHEVTRYVTPLKPFEAMAAGCCIAVSDLPALTEAIGGAACGAAFAAGDAQALTATILELGGDRGRRAELAEAARDHVRERHGLDSLRASVEAAWERIAAPTASGSAAL